MIQISSSPTSLVIVVAHVGIGIKTLGSPIIEEYTERVALTGLYVDPHIVYALLHLIRITASTRVSQAANQVIRYAVNATIGDRPTCIIFTILCHVPLASDTIHDHVILTGNVAICTDRGIGVDAAGTVVTDSTRERVTVLNHLPNPTDASSALIIVAIHLVIHAVKNTSDLVLTIWTIVCLVTSKTSVDTATVVALELVCFAWGYITVTAGCEATLWSSTALQVAEGSVVWTFHGCFTLPCDATLTRAQRASHALP